MPWFQGLAQRSTNVDNHLTAFDTPPALDPVHHRASNFVETRYHRHVIHCPTTRNALKRIQLLKKCFLALAVTAITLSCGIASSSRCAAAVPAGSGTMASKVAQRCLKALVPMIPLTSLAAAGLHKLEQRFFVSFKRKDQMRTERGI